MTFERSTDYALIDSFLTDPRAYRRMTNDAAPAREEFQGSSALPGIEYIVARDQDGPAAVFLLADIDGGEAREIHFVFSTAWWGRCEAIALAFVQWVWAHTLATRLIGPVPAYNRLALRLAEAAGFTEAATIRNAVRKRDRNYDLIVLEIKRPVKTYDKPGA